MINENLWSKHQYGVLVSYVRHLSYQRVLHDILTELKPENEFWAQTTDAHLFRSIIDWCMIFGANNNDVHWKRVVEDTAEQDSLRSVLVTAAGMGSEEWDSYWTGMVQFRNKYAAHRADVDPYPSVPYMEASLRVAVAYDKWVRGQLDAIVLDPPLESRHKHYMRTLPYVLKKLVQITPGLEDEYQKAKYNEQ